MEENRATKWRRDLVTSFRGLPKQMLHFPMESQPHSVVDPFVACRQAALLGFARLLRCTSRNFDCERRFHNGTRHEKHVRRSSLRMTYIIIVQYKFYTRTDQTPLYTIMIFMGFPSFLKYLIVYSVPLDFPSQKAIASSA